ncbi:DUF3048 domain-containing protein [Saccharothrix deserti]|uniref:DUF3048 domain-containing protein n=1 Tax=Saccharothrix deserti TaxID=2593674 RepID=UPI001EE466CE|nr:DUF3048 domain-containing protein [Saccharothrix deserti]
MGARWFSAVCAVLLVVAVSACGAEPVAETAPGASGAAQPAALVVKVDNAAAARPHTGIGSADVVYVEPVEGGLTRLAAVYWNALPEVVGPVRSARETDVELLAQYGTPVLAFSGSAPELVPLLDEARLTKASPQDVGDAYVRDESKRAPHNLYVHPPRLPKPETGAGATVLQYGPAPPGGRPATNWSVTFQRAAFDLSWSAGWAISLDGTPLVSTDSGPVQAASVVVQRVPTRTGRFVEDASGTVSPVVVTIGSGAAVVLRDGVAFDATWSRPTAADPTRFTTADGTELPLAPGRAWVFLVPA